MDCGRMNRELVPFHFGTCDDETRARVGEHLLACTRCLAAYLEIKAHAEGGELRGLEPSAALFARLRADVARAVAPSLASRARRLFAHRVPVYQLAAAAAVAGAIALAIAMAIRGQRPAEPIDAQIDDARTASMPGVL